MMNFRLKYYGLWFFALMLVGGAGRSTSAEPVFSFSNYSEPETLDPALATGFPEYKIFLGIFEGLTTLDGKTLEVQPGVAKSWQITDGGTKYTFLIRDDAKWSNGRRVVAGDFVYSWKRLLEPKFAAPFARHLFYVKGAEAFNHGDNKDFNSVAVRAISDDVLEVQLIHPTPYFLFLCSFYALMPVPQETIEKYQGAAWTKPNNIVTNGPYTLKEWLPRQRVVLEKSTSYWDSKNVSLQKIIIYPTESNETAYNLYVAGKIDWTGQTSLPDKSLMALRKRQDYHEPLERPVATHNWKKRHK
jgi:oligopeptide transport system substrate-binding protein